MRPKRRKFLQKWRRRHLQKWRRQLLQKWNRKSPKRRKRKCLQRQWRKFRQKRKYLKKKFPQKKMTNCLKKASLLMMQRKLRGQKLSQRMEMVGTQIMKSIM